VPLRNQQGVQVGHRESVSNGPDQAVLRHNRLLRNIAERTSVLPRLVGFGYFTEVRVVPISFGRVARIAECLQVVQIIQASPLSWLNVVNFQSLLVGWDSTQFAPELRSLEHLVFLRARDISCGQGAMLPDLLAPFFQVLGKFCFALRNEQVLSSGVRSANPFKEYRSLSQLVIP